jgi:hypothetical protein
MYVYAGTPVRGRMAMRWKGINYCIGTEFVPGTVSTRPEFDRHVVRREIEIIRTDLHCNAIRISGRDVERLSYAGECALDAGLSVWLSPALINASAQDTITYLVEAATAAERLRSGGRDVVFVCGCEHTLFMNGIVDGATFLERIARFEDRAFWIQGGVDRMRTGINAFFAELVPAVREQFGGLLTYASGPWEPIDWTPFDIVGIDHYRSARNKATYADELRAYKRFGKPLAVTEFGCCTYAGAEDLGGMGWAIVDWSKNPPEFNAVYVRDESVQAKYIAEILDILEAEAVDGAFVFTFVMPSAVHDDPRIDRDLASYGVVAALGSRNGTAYPDMPWEPKQAFGSLAAYYGRA